MLRERIEEVGFAVETLASLNALGLLGWTLNSRLLRRKLLPRNQLTVFEYLIPWLNWEQRLSLPWGLSLLLIARRR